MLNDNVNITMNCSRNYNENNVIEYNEKGLPIKLVIDTMKKLNLLIPMDTNIYNKLLWSYNRHNSALSSESNSKKSNYNSYRKIIVKDKKDIPKFIKRMKQGKLLFGYDISENDIEYRLNEL